MKYQLVLQLPASSITDYDDMIELEETITKRLDGLGVVDGHDAGSGEMNIFILTDSPEAVFERINAMLGTQDFMSDLKVAFREVGNDSFIILYPPGLDRFAIA